MEMSVVYTSWGGGIAYENRGGVERDYGRDGLGSTTALYDGSQNKTDEYRYWLYGEEAQSTGTNPTPFRFVGTLGYYRDSASRIYVRMRHYLSSKARWLTVDPLWPREPSYAYVDGVPTSSVDPSGRKSCSLYRWMYTGDFCASDEVYEAALEGGLAGAECYISCVGDALRKVALALLMLGLGPLANFPKSWAKWLGSLLGIRVIVVGSQFTSLLRLLELWLSQNYGIKLHLARFVKQIITNPELLAAILAAIAVAIAAACAIACSQEGSCAEESSDDGGGGGSGFGGGFAISW